jgi:hypothetical protein
VTPTQRTRALRDALDLLSGGSVSLQAAQARVNEAVTNANQAMQEGIDHADGWGKVLIKANGSLDDHHEERPVPLQHPQHDRRRRANAAIAAYDFAQSQGKDLPESLAAARGEMEKSARTLPSTSARGYGLTVRRRPGRSPTPWA